MKLMRTTKHRRFPAPKTDTAPASFVNGREVSALFQLMFEDRVGGHLKMRARTTDNCHIIETSLATKVPEIAGKWREKLTSSNYYLSQEGKLILGQAIFRISKTCAVSMDSKYCEWGSHCLILAKTISEAHETHAQLKVLFRLTKAKAHAGTPKFTVLALENRQIVPHRMPLESHPALTPEKMELSYGAGFHDWSQKLTSVFAGQSSSLTLLQGPPGTGKTSFLRWLIANSQDEADFYFVPVTCVSLLSDQNLISFWLTECHLSTKPKVLIVEDAEMLLMKRGPDNGHWVGNLLNITDGIMGDALRFHLVCSINCPFTEIDPALLRPGRLAASWTFGPITHENACRLSSLIGKSPPQRKECITLAEIYGAPVQGTCDKRSPIGFNQTNESLNKESEP